MLLGSAYGKVGLDVSGVVSGVQQAVNSLKDFKSTMELAGGGLNKLKANLDAAKVAVDAARAELDRLKAGGAAKTEIEAAAKSLKTLEGNAVTAATALNKAQTQLKQLADTGKMIGGVMTQAGQAMTIGVTLPIIAAGTAAVKFASDLNETRSKVSEIFGSMSGDINKWADGANTALGLTRQAALDGASNFALFGKAAKLSGEDLLKFSEQNVQMASDFASFFNTSPEEAITAIGAAYRGEAEPIRRYNILLNDELIKQKAAALGILDANGKLSMQSRILAVNALIMDQATSATGDFARTSGGLANQTRILQAQLHDSIALLGQNLLPAVVSVVQGLNTLLTAFQKMPVPVQQALVAFLIFLAALGPVLVVLGQLITSISAVAGAWPTITALLPGLTAGLATIGTTITATIIPALTAIGTTITATIIPEVIAIGAALLPVIAVIALVALAFGLLYFAWTTNFLGFRTTLQQLGFIIQYYIGQGINSAVAEMNQLGPALALWANQVGTTFQQISVIVGFYMDQGMQSAIRAIISAGPIIQKAWQGMILYLQTAWTSFIQMLNTAWTQVWISIISYLSNAVSQVLNYVSNLRDSILSYFNIDWGQIGSNIINGIINGLAAGAGALYDAIKAIIDNLLAIAGGGSSTAGISKAGVSGKSNLKSLSAFARQPDAGQVANSISKSGSENQSNGTYQQINHFANGLTLRDVQRMLDERDQQLMNTFSQAFGS